MHNLLLATWSTLNEKQTRLKTEQSFSNSNLFAFVAMKKIKKKYWFTIHLIFTTFFACWVLILYLFRRYGRARPELAISLISRDSFHCFFVIFLRAKYLVLTVFQERKEEHISRGTKSLFENIQPLQKLQLWIKLSLNANENVKNINVCLKLLKTHNRVKPVNFWSHGYCH